jgi:hypothetical protein
MTVAQPILTWNFFSTPICILLLGIWWKYMLDKKEKKDMERDKLIEENLKLKEKAVEDWREGFAKNLCAVKVAVEDWRKSHANSLEEIADKVESINSKLYGLVTRADCEDDHAKAEEKLEEHSEKITKLETTVEMVKNRFKWEITK